VASWRFVVRWLGRQCWQARREPRPAPGDQRGNRDIMTDFIYARVCTTGVPALFKWLHARECSTAINVEYLSRHLTSTAS